MTTPGFGTNPYEHKTPAPGRPQQPQPEQRNLVPIICAIAILIALVISGAVIWNHVRSTSPENPSASHSSEQTPAPREETSPEGTEEEDKEHASREEAPTTSASLGAADVPEGLTAAGWSDYPDARCQEGEDMVFAAAGSDPDAHIVICEKQDSLFYRGMWSSGAAFGPARGAGSSYSASILDPTSGEDTGSVLTIRGSEYDIDGEAGAFTDYWPR